MGTFPKSVKRKPTLFAMASERNVHHFYPLFSRDLDIPTHGLDRLPAVGADLLKKLSAHAECKLIRTI